MDKSLESAYKLRILKISTFLISSVVVVELTLGLIVNSLSILSDGLHASLDVVTGILLFLATKAAAKPPDEEHLYGHEKFEPIGALIGSIALIGVALLVEYEAVMKLIQGIGVNETLELAGFFAIGFTFVVDISRLVIFRKSGHIQSTTVKAGFYDAISDFGSTVVAFAGFSIATLARFYWGYSLGSIVLGVLLGYLSLRLARKSVVELSDSASKDFVERIKQAIQSQTGSLKTLNLRTRRVGSKVFVETTLQVPNSMSLEEAHGVSSNVESKLASVFGEVEVTIHIEPTKKDSGLKQIVEQQAMVEGVRGIHGLSTIYSGGKLYITLHVHVDPKMTVRETHKIAEQIEKNLHTAIKQVENVTVHVGPHVEEEHELETGDEEIRRIIREVVQNTAGKLQVKKVVNYRAGNKLYVNINCGFRGDLPIVEAHKLASEIENEAEKRLFDSVVTVHLEPLTES